MASCLFAFECDKSCIKLAESMGNNLKNPVYPFHLINGYANFVDYTTPFVVVYSNNIASFFWASWFVFFLIKLKWRRSHKYKGKMKLVSYKKLSFMLGDLLWGNVKY